MSKVKFVKIKDVKTPEVGSVGSAGIDFFIPETSRLIRCQPFSTVKIPLGIKLVIPKGHVLLLQDKSGLANKLGLLVIAGVIDSDYRGEIHACFVNATSSMRVLKPGDKVIQGVVVEYINELEELKDEEAFEEASEQWGESTRGDKGFGKGTDSTYKDEDKSKK